jgi:hypothetical protein
MILIYLVKFKKCKCDYKVVSIKLTHKLFGSEIEYSISRSFMNIEIANRIYIELITRKAAVPFDENHDVIVEVYNSWYTLFNSTRDELKKLPGDILLNKSTKNLIQLLTDVLNLGLRPHLTEYQAKFRKWFVHELSLKKNKECTPQEIQKKYKDYDKLINSIKEVNELLIEYKEKLAKFIYG